MLVYGGAGEVGSEIVQLAISRGLKTIATVSSPEKAKYATACGANIVVEQTRGEFAKRVLNETGRHGVDAIFVCVGQAVVDGNVQSIRTGGKWLYYGSTSGHASFPGVALLTKSIHLIGFVIFQVFQDHERWQRGVMALKDILKAATLSPKVEVFPAHEVRAVHQLLEERRIAGKAVFDMSSLDSGDLF